MRLSRTGPLLVTFSLLIWTATTYAECAWVLWTEVIQADGGQRKLSVTDTFDTKEQCATRLEYSTALIERGLGGRMVGNMVVVSSKDGKPSLMFNYHCLPDTVDPRGEKGAR